MSRYIDADKMQKDLDERKWVVTELMYSWITSLIERQPTVDVVEVVRCKDCVSSRPLNRNDRFESRYSEGCIYCMRTDEGVAYDDYCSYGEKRNDG